MHNAQNSYDTTIDLELSRADHGTPHHEIDNTRSLLNIPNNPSKDLPFQLPDFTTRWSHTYDNRNGLESTQIPTVHTPIHNDTSKQVIPDDVLSAKLLAPSNSIEPSIQEFPNNDMFLRNGNVLTRHAGSELNNSLPSSAAPRARLSTNPAFAMETSYAPIELPRESKVDENGSAMYISSDDEIFDSKDIQTESLLVHSHPIHGLEPIYRVSAAEVDKEHTRIDFVVEEPALIENEDNPSQHNLQPTHSDTPLPDPFHDRTVLRLMMSSLRQQDRQNLKVLCKNAEPQDRHNVVVHYSIWRSWRIANELGTPLPRMPRNICQSCSSFHWKRDRDRLGPAMPHSTPWSEEISFSARPKLAEDELGIVRRIEALYRLPRSEELIDTYSQWLNWRLIARAVGENLPRKLCICPPDVCSECSDFHWQGSHPHSQPCKCCEKCGAYHYTRGKRATTCKMYAASIIRNESKPLHDCEDGKMVHESGSLNLSGSELAIHPEFPARFRGIANDSLNLGIHKSGDEQSATTQTTDRGKQAASCDASILSDEIPQCASEHSDSSVPLAGSFRHDSTTSKAQVSDCDTACVAIEDHSNNKRDRSVSPSSDPPQLKKRVVRSASSVERDLRYQHRQGQFSRKMGRGLSRNSGVPLRARPPPIRTPDSGSLVVYPGNLTIDRRISKMRKPNPVNGTAPLDERIPEMESISSPSGHSTDTSESWQIGSAQNEPLSIGQQQRMGTSVVTTTKAARQSNAPNVNAECTGQAESVHKRCLQDGRVRLTSIEKIAIEADAVQDVRPLITPYQEQAASQAWQSTPSQAMLTTEKQASRMTSPVVAEELFRFREINALLIQDATDQARLQDICNEMASLVAEQAILLTRMRKNGLRTLAMTSKHTL